MAQGLIGVNGAPRNITEVYVGVGGARMTCTSVYVGVNGAPRLAWSGNKYKGVMFACAAPATALYTVDKSTGAQVDTGKKYLGVDIAGYKNFFYSTVPNANAIQKIDADTMAVVLTSPIVNGVGTSSNSLGIAVGSLWGITNNYTQNVGRYDPKILAHLGEINTGISSLNRDGIIGMFSGNSAKLFMKTYKDMSNGDTYTYPTVYEIASGAKYDLFAGSSNLSMRSGVINEATEHYTIRYQSNRYHLYGNSTALVVGFASRTITIMQ